jgi:TonB family protein
MKACLCVAALMLITVASAVVVSAQIVASDQPEVVAAVAPIFPAIAAAAKASGDVIVEVKIDQKGTVFSAHAVEGHPLLQKVCEATARRWKFVAAKDSKSARAVRLTFTFRVVDDMAPEIDRTPVFLPPYKIELAGPKVVIKTVTVH